MMSESAASDGSARAPLGFVGVGTMGSPMAARLLDAGHQVYVHDPSPAAIETVAGLGALGAGSPAAVAEAADVVMLSLPTPEVVEAVVLGGQGVLAATRLPHTVIDLSTNSPESVRRLATACAEVGVAFVDAPVSGGVAGAVAGTLSVMVGAEDPVFAEIEPLLCCLGSNVLHVGASGAGTVAKIVNNQLFLAAGVLVQEAYVTGQALGISPAELHNVISASSAGPYAKLAPLLLGRRFDDVIFRLDIAAKDLRLAAEAAEGAGVDAAMTRAAIDVYDGALTAGDGSSVFHATLRELERRAGLELPALRRPPRKES